MSTAVKNKFYTSRYDRVFKAVFKDEKDHHLMEALLETCLEQKVKIIKYYDNELKVRSVSEKSKRLDVLIEIDGKRVSVELNTKYDEVTKVRNLSFFTSFYSQHTKVGEKYDVGTEFIQINISFGMGIKRPIKNEYKIYSNETKDAFVDNFKIIEINMDRLMNAWYDNDEKEIEKYKYLIMLDLDREGLEKMNKKEKDKIIEEYKDRVYTLNGEIAFIAPLSAEEDEKLLENTRIDLSRKEGLKEGLKQGEKKEKISIIKRMLKEKMSIEIISKITNLSKEEIKELGNY